MESERIEDYIFNNLWTLYFHDPYDHNWDLSSYKFISTISNVQDFVNVFYTFKELFYKGMFFIMREHITPRWEDEHNKEGGCFSYKVVNKTVTSVWRKLMYLLCGNSLTVDPKHNEYVNGITISPKKGFCIVKIWMKNCKLQDPAIIANIDGLIKNGCLFKAHCPEF